MILHSVEYEGASAVSAAFDLNTALASSTVSSRDTAHVSRIASTRVPTVALVATSTAMSRGRLGRALAESTTSTRMDTRSRASGSPDRIIGNTSKYLGALSAA